MIDQKEYYSKKENRNRAYRQALAIVKLKKTMRQDVFLCCTLERIAYNETRNPCFDASKIFPEFAAHKPTHADNYTSWWPASENGRKFNYDARIACLEECIKQTS